MEIESSADYMNLLGAKVQLEQYSKHLTVTTVRFKLSLRFLKQ